MQTEATTRTKTSHYCSSGWTLVDGQHIHSGECLNDGNVTCETVTLTAEAKKVYTSKGLDRITWRNEVYGYRSQTWEPTGTVTVEGK